MKTKELELYLNDLLEVPRFMTNCPNGLQVQGRSEVTHVVSRCDGQPGPRRSGDRGGSRRHPGPSRIFLENEDARAHRPQACTPETAAWRRCQPDGFPPKPLDNHPELGNNAQLGPQPGFMPNGRFSDDQLGWTSTLPQKPMPLHALNAHVGAVLQREPLAIGDPDQMICKVGWCTGRAQGYFDAAVAAGVDVYLERRGLGADHPTSRARAAWPTWPPAIMPRSATASARWAEHLAQRLGGANLHRYSEPV